ncbi:hypothetical protein D3C85_1676860 [compost metagenome]
MTGEQRREPHELDLGTGSKRNICEFGLLEIAGDPETLAVDNEHVGATCNGIITGLQTQLGDVAIYGRKDLGAL